MAFNGHFVVVIAITLYSRFRHIWRVDIMERCLCVMGSHHRQCVFILDNDTLQALTYRSQICRITFPQVRGSSVFALAVTTES